MIYYSAKIEMPKTRKDGLCNFVQMIINQAEAGETQEALLLAVDLLDTLRGDANPFSSITDGSEAKLGDELKRQFAVEKAEAIKTAHQQGYDEGVAAEKRRMAAALGLVE